jgi:hypothetical protein
MKKTILTNIKYISSILVIILSVLCALLVINQTRDKKLKNQKRSEEKPNSSAVLAINTDKNQYLLGEKAEIFMASLDEKGDTLCQSQLILEITDPDGKKSYLSTNEKNIINNPTCGHNNVTNDPDYIASWNLEKLGQYKLKLKDSNTGKETETDIEVKESLPLEIKRNGATRINPSASDRYPMIITLKTNKDFRGEVVEEIPGSFELAWYGPAKVEQKEDKKILSWQVELKAGEAKELKYEYTAPKVSPEFYLLGPLSLEGQKTTSVWQIASDGSITFGPGESGSWQAPITGNVTVECWAGGGGGGGPGNTNKYGGGGGAGGQYSIKVVSVTQGSYYSYSVGTGGAAGSGDGGTGGDTVFGSSTVVAKGGAGGKDYDNGGNGGQGSTSGGVGDTVYAGGSGANGTTTYSGGGGGGAGSTGTGKNASTTTGGGATSEYGGAGGNGSASNNGNGSAGSNYGGGGGGGAGKTGTAAAGAGGFMRITWTASISGYVYGTDESSVVTSGPLVRVKVNGTGDYSANANSSGYYEITNVDMSTGDSLTVYLDTGGGISGATFTRSTGSNMSNINIYQDRATIRCDNSSCSLTNADINYWDKSNDSDIHAASDGTNLTVDNDWKLLIVANTFAPGGTVTTSSGGSNSYSGDIEIKSGATLDMNGNNLTIGGAGTGSSRPFIVSGTYTSGTNTTTYNGTSTSDIDATPSYSSLTVNSSGVTFSPNGNLTITGNLTISAGTLDLGSYTANRSSAGGTLTVSNGAALKIGGTNTLPSNYSTHSIGSTSTIEYSGTNQTVSGLNSSQSYGYLTISGSGTKTLGAAITVDSTLTINNGNTLDCSTNNYNLTANNISNSGTLNIRAATLTINGTSGTLFTNSGTFTAGTNSTTQFTGAGSPTALLSGTFTGSNSFYHLQMSPSIAGATTYDVGTAFNANGNLTLNPSGSNTLTVNLGGNSTVSGTTSVSGSGSASSVLDTKSGSNYTFTTGVLSIGSAGTFNANNSNPITLNGSSTTVFSNSGTFNAGGSTVVVSGSNAALSFTSATTLNNLTISGTITTSSNMTINGTLDVSNSLTASGGTVTTATTGWTITNTGSLTFNNLTISETPSSQSNVSFSVSGTLTVNSTKNFSPAGGTVTFNNGSSISNSGTLAFQGIAIASSASVSGSGDFSVAGNFTINNGGVYTPAAAQVISGSGTLTGSGTARVTRTTSTPDFSSQYTLSNKDLTNLIVEYAGDANQTVSALTYGYLKISNTNSSVATLANNTTVGKDLTISSGGILSLGGYTLTVGGNWTNNGTFTHANGTVVFNDNSQISTISGSNTFYNFTCVTPGKILQFETGITQNLVISGGVFTLTGDLGNNIQVKSTSSGNQWYINHQGTESVSYVTVTDSGCNGSTDITVQNGTNGGNNGTCWVFGEEPTPTPTPTPGGAIFNFDGGLNMEGINIY